MAFFFGDVHFLASGTVYFDPRSTDLFAHSDRKCRLTVAQNSRTHSESSFTVLFPHDCQTFGGDYISRMDESVDISGLLVN